VNPAVKIYFKEWLPDLPTLDNDGLLEATNVLPMNGSYKSSPSLTTTGYTTANAATLAGVFNSQGKFGELALSISTANSLKALRFGATLSSTINGTRPFIEFYRWGDDEYYFSGQTLSSFVSAGPNWVNVTGAPSCDCLDRINSFLVVGGPAGLNYSVQWSSIDQPTDWPTPLSSTAVVPGYQWICRGHHWR
jgi:hypothetical protein